jgi:DNA-binding NtrC family response regulator
LAAEGQVPYRIVFTSSTAVYGQTDGSWVEETSPNRARDSRGRRLLQAERLLEAWPGNIRELQNVVEREVILARGNVLGVSDFELPSLGSDVVRPRQGGTSGERQQIEEALAASRGRVYGVEGAAEILGVPPSGQAA